VVHNLNAREVLLATKWIGNESKTRREDEESSNGQNEVNWGGWVVVLGAKMGNEKSVIELFKGIKEF